MDLPQIIIISVTVVLTLLLIVLGIQVFFILKEVRISFQKMNRMLNDFGKVTGTIGDSVVNMAGFVNGLKAGFSVFRTLRGGKDDEHE